MSVFAQKAYLGKFRAWCDFVFIRNAHGGKPVAYPFSRMAVIFPGSDLAHRLYINRYGWKFFNFTASFCIGVPLIDSPMHE